MNVPVTFKVVTVLVDNDGTLAVAIDGVPHMEGRQLRRSDLGQVVEEIACEADEPVRVEVHENDGTTYTDIVLPPRPDAVQADLDPPVHRPAGSGITGGGFIPGEKVAIAYVLARQDADREGTATLRLPPAVLRARTEHLVLVGLDSGLITHVSAA